MKKISIFICIAILLSLKTTACDICGCGIGNAYIGILPDFNKRIFGIRYRYNSLLTHIGVGGTTTYLTTKEKYRTVEFWGGWNITSNIRIMAAAPYSFNEQLNQGATKTKDGPGDISLSGFYQLLNNKRSIFTDKLLVQSLWIGGGIKLPTGRYNHKDKSTAKQNANLFQLGTGSIDFSVNAMYDIRLQDAGLNLTASYKINTTNKYDYSYGNKFSTSVQTYYKFSIKNSATIAPNAGILYETAKKDIDNKFSVDVSGGHLLLGTIGTEVAFKKISIGGNWQTPFSQNLANGIVKANNRMMVHISFML